MEKFIAKLIFICIICGIVMVASTLISYSYIINYSNMELNNVRPEAYKDYDEYSN